MVRLGGDLTFEGVLGNLDGDPDNDMTLRDGTVIEQPANDNKVRRFADSWRVPEPESLVSVGEAPVPVPEVAEAPLEPEDLDPAAVEEATQACQDAGVDDPLAVETCVYDVAATGNEDFVDSSATLQEAVEELPESAPEPVFATEEPDLVPDESSRASLDPDRGHRRRDHRPHRRVGGPGEQQEEDPGRPRPTCPCRG